jgi:uncharacterized membrane protein
MALLLASQASSDTIGLLFTYFFLFPALVTGLVVVIVVTAKGEKREDQKYDGRWGTKRPRVDD